MSTFQTNKSKNVATAGLLAAAAILLGYVEHLLPVVPPITGIKLGLGNIAVLLALRMLPSPKIALGIMLTKVTVCALLFSGISALPYSLAGGAVSWAIMALLCQYQRLSAAGVSAAGGAAHMVAQVAVAALITSTAEVMILLPLLTAIGTATGFLNGIIVNFTRQLHFTT